MYCFPSNSVDNFFIMGKKTYNHILRKKKKSDLERLSYDQEAFAEQAGEH